jgi:hypothetical protein
MAPDEQPEARRLALLVATGTYSDPGLAALRAPAGDVHSLAGVLGDEQIGGFAVRELIDRPTEELKREIEGFFGAARRHDLLLLYVSGHGVLSQNRRFYLATSTTALLLLRSTAIEDSFVNDVMQQSRARSIVLMLDCCHSGAFAKGLVPKSTTSVDVEHRFEGQGRVVLSASTDLEYAFEESDPATGINEVGHVAPGSLFTRSVVDGLRTGDADLDEDGRISVDDLYDYVYDRIRERSPNQTPGRAGDVKGQIVLARSPRRAVLPLELVRAAASSLPGVREGAASDLAALLAAGGEQADAARATLERLARDVNPGVADTARAALGRPPQKERVEPQPKPKPDPEPWRPRWRLIALVAAGVAAAVALVVVLVGGGAAKPPPVPAAYDFDPDGRQDVVLGLANAATAEDDVDSGVVLIATGDRKVTLLTGEQAGVPPPATGSDRFGTAIASGDFDRDGIADLAVGAPGRKALCVLYGLNQRRQQIREEDLRRPSAGGVFAFSLVARDFDGDGYADLAVGTPGAQQGITAGQPGSIELLFGGPDGLTAASARRLETTYGAGFGTRMAAGDVDGDGNLDLVTGSPDESGSRGGLAFCPGTPGGLQACARVDGAGPTSSLAIADVDGDGRGDVLQGDTTGAGTIRAWPGRRDLRDPQTLDQDSDGIPGSAVDGDEFGHDVIARDLDGDHRAEVIVAARSDDGGNGSVTVIRGARRLGDAGAYQITRAAPEGKQFGATLTLLDVDGDDRPELFVGVKGVKSLDQAVVAYPGTRGVFGEGDALGGMADLATMRPTSPLRLGR